MCNKSEYIKEVTDYVYSILDEKLTLSPLDRHLSDTIPIAISHNFKLYKGTLLDHPLIFAFIHDQNLVSPALLKRSLNLIEKKCGYPVILVAENIASYNIGRLTTQRANFIVPKKQMFIPSLLINLKKVKKIGRDIKKNIPPIAQYLLLYHMEIASIDRCDTQELMKIFQVSYATINRSLRWLSRNELISLEGKKTKKLRLIYHGKELWEKALPFLVSPIERIVFTDTFPDESLKCGINALSEYTMLNEEQIDMVAIGKTDIQKADIPVDKEYGEFRIEVWKYDPKLLSQTGTVDKLSLYLSLRDNEDERIQIELDNLLNDMIW